MTKKEVILTALDDAEGADSVTIIIEIERAINLVEELGRITDNNQSADDLDAVSRTLSKLLLDAKEKAA